MRSLRLFRIGLLLFCCFSVFNGVASAQIPATDDAYTASSSGSGNFGTQPMLNVIGPGVNSYIRFDLTALPPNLTSANVSKATLRLNINGVTMSGAFDVYLVTRSWTEGTLIYNNAPTLGTKVASAIMITTSKRNFIDVDVTPAVQAWFTSPNPAPNYGIALVPSSGSSISVSFDSKENTATSHDPELMVSMVSAGAQGPSGPAGPVGATGPQGATGAQGVMGPQGPPGLQGPPGIDGAPGSPGPVGPPGAGGALNGIQEFNSTGTWTAPGGVTHILVELWGAGGGGGQGGGGFCDETGDCSSGHFGGGGGAGGYTRAVVAVTPGTTYNVIVGDGGTGGSSGTAGTPGAAGADGSASEIQDSSGAVLVSAAGGGGGKGGSGAGLSGLGTSAGGIGGSGANTVGRNGGDATGLGKGGIPASGSIQLSLINIGAGFPPANPGQGGAGGQGSPCDDATLNCFPGAHGFDGLRGYILLTY